SNLGAALLREGKVDDAISELQKGLELEPNQEVACYDLGEAFLRKGDIPTAENMFEKALAINSEYAPAYNNLANLYAQTGRTREAVQHYEIALKLRPRNAQIMNNLAWLLATSLDASLRDGSRAVQLASQADNFANGLDPVYKATLAAAYAETGRFSEAI